MASKKIIIAGGTGFIGQSLVRHFAKQHQVIVLSRFQSHSSSNAYDQTRLTAAEGYDVRYLPWDGQTAGDWVKELDKADLLINLAGKSVNCRYHSRQKRELIASRVNSTRILGQAIRSLPNPPAVWINAASTTIYRNSADQPNDECSGRISEARRDNMPYNPIDQLRLWKNKWLWRWFPKKDLPDPDQDISVHICREWEKVFEEQQTSHTMKITLRMAIVLGRGGVLTPYLRLCRWGLGGKQGNGRQLFSWVHETDLARMIDWLWSEKKQGIYNCASPGALPNTALMRSLRKTVGRSWGLPAPSWLLEFGAWLIGTETELLLKSRWVIPSRALREGFQFQFPSLNEALSELSR